MFLPLQGIWIPEGDTVKLPVAIKVIHDRTGRHTFNKLTDVRKHDLKDLLYMLYPLVFGCLVCT